MDDIAAATLDQNSSDTCKWLLESDGVFKTKRLSMLIDGKRSNITNQGETLKNKAIPLKVDIFVWRVKLLRLPVRVELDKRGVDLDSILCPICKINLETVDHSLTQCPNMFFGSIFSSGGIFLPSTLF
ncbi:uncharacterized protein [Rutidosis leptorrhynchoides]|uniref:uncharacterized protein n=1 Tax=Rutidosis leptorrhynchoides TaxID=125765 RepID=UPI003A991112